jgi:hypothetical protein
MYSFAIKVRANSFALILAVVIVSPDEGTGLVAGRLGSTPRRRLE